MRILWSFLSFLLFCPSAVAGSCAWCVDGNDKVKKEIASLGKMSPKAQLSYVRHEGLCVSLLTLDLEDEIAIASETIEEAQQRLEYDREAMNFVNKEKIPEFLNRKITEYKKQLGI